MIYQARRDSLVRPPKISFSRSEKPLGKYLAAQCSHAQWMNSWPLNQFHSVSLTSVQRHSYFLVTRYTYVIKVTKSERDIIPQMSSKLRHGKHNYWQRAVATFFHLRLKSCTMSGRIGRFCKNYSQLLNNLAMAMTSAIQWKRCGRAGQLPSVFTQNFSLNWFRSMFRNVYCPFGKNSCRCRMTVGCAEYPAAVTGESAGHVFTARSQHRYWECVYAPAPADSEQKRSSHLTSVVNVQMIYNS